MKQLYFLFFLCYGSLICWSQEINISLIDSISFSKNTFHNFVGVDNYENLYFSNFETVTKIKDHQKWVYTNFELGIPSSISIINPLQVLIFYKETNTIILLDRFLNETRRIDLNQLNPPKIGWWVENTKNQEVWLYNGETNRLLFFNYRNNISLSQTIPFLETPITLVGNFNTAYVLFKNKIHQYNIYGTLLNSVEVDNLTKIKIGSSYVIGAANNQFKIYDTDLKFIGNFKFSKNSPIDFSLREEKLYIYQNSMLFIYNLAIPTK